MKLKFVLLFVAAFWTGSNAGRILMIVTTEFPSHFILADSMVEAMAARGHEVHVISPRKQKNSTNITHCQLTGTTESLRKIDLLDIGTKSFWNENGEVMEASLLTADATMQHPCIQNIIKGPKEHFDLIFLELFFNECLFGLSHRLDAPVIVFTTMGGGIWCNHLVGNPAPISYVPHYQSKFDGKMTFWQRISNLFQGLSLEILRKYYYFPKVDIILHKYIPDAPPIFELMYKRTAMLFLNSNPITTEPQPRMPAVVEIGGYHIKDPKPLSPKLQQLMDEAEHGVIFFSMGSILQSEFFSNATKLILLKTFSKLKETVIWKGEDYIEGSPNNVVFMKWCPQNDLFAHPNLKLFISHGGLLSKTEAIRHGVPILGLPVFAEQTLNTAMGVRKGYALKIPFFEITEERLYSAIKEMLTNPKYKLAAQQASKNLANEPMKPLDKAMFYINQVIENRGASHLRSAVMDLEWYQVYLLDIYCFFIITLYLFVFIIHRTIKYICYKIIMRRIKRKVS